MTLRIKRQLSAIALALGFSLAVSACGGGRDEDRRERANPALPIEIERLIPDFDPARSLYVARCGADRPADVESGEDFGFAIGDDGEGQRTYRVRCLPEDFPDWHFQRLGSSSPGMFVVAFKAEREARPWVIVFDHQGAPRWWYSPARKALWGQVLRDGDFSWARSFGDGYGLDPRMAHEVRSPTGELRRLVRTKGSIIDGHEYREVGDDGVLTATYVPETADLRRFGGPRRAAIVAAEVQELGPDGQLRWRWNSRDRIALAETGRWWRNVLSNPRRRLQGLPAFDPVHINSVEPRGADEVVISTRHTDATYGIRRSSGEIAWKLGGTETPESLRIVGDPAEKLLGGQHDARIATDGTLSIYDNGKDRPRRPRVVFYRLEPAQGRATYLGQLNDPNVRRSHCCGSARELEGGGWLVSWGDNKLVTGFDAGGKVSFRLRLPASTYRAVPVPGAATTAARLHRAMDAMEGGG